MNLSLAYLRVSTDQQALSLEAQTQAVRRAATYHELPVPALYSDEDRSGSIPFLDREGGAELFADAQRLLAEGHHVTLFVPKVDRFGRDMVDVVLTVRRLHAMNVRLVFLDINVDTTRPEGMMFLQLIATFAEWELSRIRDRIRTALDHKKAGGELCGDPPLVDDEDTVREREHLLELE